MVNRNSESRLLVTLKMGSRTLNLELAPDTKLVIGRSSTADIQLDEASVSNEHLKIVYTGSLLLISDLETSNGTFRLPSEAPFVEAEFSTAAQDLELRLGKAESVRLQWQLKTATTEMTKTAFESSEMAASDAIKSSAKVENGPADGAPIVDKPENAAGSSDFVAKAEAKPSKPVSAYVKVFVLLVYSASILAMSRMIWRSDLGFAERVPKDLRGVGLGIDILAVSLAGYSMRGWLLAGLCLVLAFVFYHFWIRTLKHRKIRIALGIWAVLVSVWPITYPFVLAARNGVGLSHLRALRDSQRLLDSSAYTLDEKTKMFSELLPHLRGSSYFYSKVINLFFERVVDECGGAWKDDWNKKKLCLILINSVSVEALTDIKPKVLAPIALRLVLITSLDSIMRIFPVEGPSSEMNDIFLKSVESVGLKEEAARMRGILKATNTTSAQKVESLQKLKSSVELRLDSLNYELAIPDVMRIYPPDVLALGI